MPQAQPSFDVDAARKAGYGDDEILSHLTQSRKFDIDGALKAGYSKSDIIGHLSSEPIAMSTRGLPKGKGGYYGGRPIDFLLSHNVKRTSVEDQAVHEHLREAKTRGGQGMEELGGALMLPMVGGTIGSGAGLLKTLGTGAYKTGTTAAGGAVGYAAGEKGAKMLGLPPNVAHGIGFITSLLGARLGMKLNPGDVGKFLEETKDPTFGKFFKWMQERGKPPVPPTAKEASVPEMREAVKNGLLTPEEFETEMRSQGYSEHAAKLARYNVQSKLQETAAKTAAKEATKQAAEEAKRAAENAPKAPEPFKPNPAILRKTKWVGRTEPYLNKLPAKVIKPRQTAVSSAKIGAAANAAPAAPSPSPVAPTPRADVDPRQIGFERVTAQAQAKDVKVAQRLIDKGITPEQAAAIPEDKLNVHIRAAGFRPFAGKNLSRSFAAGRADIVNAMHKLMAGGKPQ